MCLLREYCVLLALNNDYPTKIVLINVKCLVL